MIHSGENLLYTLRAGSRQQVLGAANRYFVRVSCKFLHRRSDKSFQGHLVEGASRRLETSAEFGGHIRRNEFDDFHLRVSQLLPQRKRERMDRGLRGAVHRKNREGDECETRRNVQQGRVLLI